MLDLGPAVRQLHAMTPRDGGPDQSGQRRPPTPAGDEKSEQEERDQRGKRDRGRDDPADDPGQPDRARIQRALGAVGDRRRRLEPEAQERRERARARRDCLAGSDAVQVPDLGGRL